MVWIRMGQDVLYQIIAILIACDYSFVSILPSQRY